MSLTIPNVQRHGESRCQSPPDRWLAATSAETLCNSSGPGGVLRRTHPRPLGAPKVSAIEAVPLPDTSRRGPEDCPSQRCKSQGGSQQTTSQPFAVLSRGLVPLQTDRPGPPRPSTSASTSVFDDRPGPSEAGPFASAGTLPTPASPFPSRLWLPSPSLTSASRWASECQGLTKTLLDSWP